MDPFDSLLAAVKAKESPTGRPLLIGISGFGGSGKSTLARKLASVLGGVEVVTTDDFWVPEQDLRSDSWDAYDRDRLAREVLTPAREGQAITYQVFDWDTGALGGWRDVPASPYLVVEGIGLFHPHIFSYFDFTVWVDCPLEVAQERGLRRGREEYGIDETERWINVWTPNDHDFFERYRPDQQADIVYPNARKPDAL